MPHSALPHASAAPPAAGVAAAPAFLDIAAQAGCRDEPIPPWSRFIQLGKADAVNEEDSESDNATSVRCPAVWLTTYDANRL